MASEENRWRRKFRILSKSNNDFIGEVWLQCWGRILASLWIWDFISRHCLLSPVTFPSAFIALAQLCRDIETRVRNINLRFVCFPSLIVAGLSRKAFFSPLLTSITWTQCLQFQIEISNLTRFLFRRFSKRYELPLLIQSVVMNITMFLMIHLCVKVRRNNNIMRARERVFSGKKCRLAFPQFSDEFSSQNQRPKTWKWKSIN